MLREHGVVTRIGAGFAWVSSAGQSDCRRCAAGQGCGGGLLARLLGRRLYQVRAVADEKGLSVGDEVIIAVAAGSLVRGALLSYGLPLAGLLLGTAVAAGLGEGAAIVAALGGLAAGFALARLAGRALARDRRLQPTIVERL